MIPLPTELRAHPSATLHGAADPEDHPRRHDRVGHVVVPGHGTADTTDPQLTAALVNTRLDMESQK